MVAYSRSVEHLSNGITVKGPQVTLQDGCPHCGMRILPAAVEEAYKEAKLVFDVGAYTSCELMCRKILMNSAAEKGAGHGKSFAYYVSYLQDQGYLSPVQQTLADHIRKRGNKATHELPKSDSSLAQLTLVFTEMTLLAVYAPHECGSE